VAPASGAGRSLSGSGPVREFAVLLEGVGTRRGGPGAYRRRGSRRALALAEPGPGEVYWHDLMGLEAFSLAGLPLGRVTGVMELPAHRCWVLRGERERLVPLVRERLAGVDLAAGRLTLDWHPDGLNGERVRIVVVTLFPSSWGTRWGSGAGTSHRARRARG